MGMPLKDRTGFRHGKITVIEKVLSDKGNMWLCRCDCGNTMLIAGKRLKPKNCPQSCGCYTKELLSRSILASLNPRHAAVNLQYNSHVQSSKRESRYGKPLPREEWEKIVFQPCHYCGETDVRHMPPSRVRQWKCLNEHPELSNQYSLSINGVDRIDSEEGYLVSNCVPCCRMCNMMKSGYTQTDFIQRTKRIYEHRQLHLESKKPICYAVTKGVFARKPKL